MSKVESIEDLLKQQTELQAKIEKIRSEEKSKVIEELKKINHVTKYEEAINNSPKLPN